VLEASSGDGAATLGRLLRLTYAPVCHQMPERSLAAAGLPLPVCTRCTGLYLGGLAGLVAGALRRGRGWRAPHRVWLLAALAPSGVDFVLGHLGGPALSNVPRLLVAFPAGVVAGLFLCEGLADLGRMIRTGRRPAGLATGARD
jgi:uncharacterized membrane protein